MQDAGEAARDRTGIGIFVFVLSALARDWIPGSVLGASHWALAD